MSGSLIFLFLFISCSKVSREINLTGNTMGTTYSIKIIIPGDQNPDQQRLQAGVDSILAEINRQMSTWDKTSEISLFNQLSSSDKFTVSTHFQRVVKQALELSQLTEGAFDITVGPLITLWGFGSSMSFDHPYPPTPEQVAGEIKNVGYQKIGFHNNQLIKLDQKIVIDVNAIAKGYGVDIVSDWLSLQGFTDFLVEIGGEVYCAGLNRAGNSWQIGIDTPVLNALPGRDLQAIVPLSEQGMATSGDYRNYFEYDGKIYSHVIDPRTGYPVETGVASATVLAPTCGVADALATGLMVMGASQGLELIESLQDVEAVLIMRTGINEFQLLRTTGMKIRDNTL